MAWEHRCRLPQTSCSNKVVHKLSIVKKKKITINLNQYTFKALVCTSSRWVIVSLGRGSLLLEAFDAI